jgi:hypothetical protein
MYVTEEQQKWVSEDDEEGAEIGDHTSHCRGLKAIDTPLAYVEQQTAATGADVLSGADVTTQRKGRRLK